MDGDWDMDPYLPNATWYSVTPDTPRRVEPPLPSPLFGFDIDGLAGILMLFYFISYYISYFFFS